MPEVTPKMTAEEAAKLFAKQNITVKVVKADRKGVPQRDPDTNRYLTEDQPLAAAHIIGIAERAGEVGITTLDGQKYAAAIK
ncbi:MAG: hypothetical protein Q7U97_13855 [Rhodocyclaceae bacterium]|nr:hypothetical protein [Rhodocyclaceae bacterium]